MTGGGRLFPEIFCWSGPHQSRCELVRAGRSITQTCATGSQRLRTGVGFRCCQSACPRLPYARRTLWVSCRTFWVSLSPQRHLTTINLPELVVGSGHRPPHQKRRFRDVRRMSALPPITEVQLGARRASALQRCRPITALAAAMMASPRQRSSHLRYPRLLSHSIV